MDAEHGLIDDAVAHDDFSEALGVRRKMRRLFAAAKNSVRHSDRVFARHSDDGDGAFANRS